MAAFLTRMLAWQRSGALLSTEAVVLLKTFGNPFMPLITKQRNVFLTLSHTLFIAK